MKIYYTMVNVGRVKYVINFHNGLKTHNDGSRFFDVATFKNKKEFLKYESELIKQGYTQNH